MNKHKETMHTAYRVADELLRDRLKSKSAELLHDLEQFSKADVLVIRGVYDHIERVFDISGTPYTVMPPAAMNEAPLRPDQIIFVNCPGHLEPTGLRQLVSFVESGGFLFTTDWAIKHILEPAFPGIVEFNHKPTKDEVVRVEILAQDDPFLSSILGPEDDPQWWLESSSYPIRILQPERVKVLATSPEIASRYGESPVFITFEHGQGRVYHMISHFYLQRSETRTARHQASSFEYLAEKGIPQALLSKYKELGAGRLTSADLESALTSSGMLARILWEKKQQLKKDQKK